jgi:hypothetical protein
MFNKSPPTYRVNQQKMINPSKEAKPSDKFILKNKSNVVMDKTNQKSKNQYSKTIIICSIIICVSILLSGGIYSFESPRMGVVQRYHKFTGVIELCVIEGKEFQCGKKKTN